LHWKFNDDANAESSYIISDDMMRINWQGKPKYLAETCPNATLFSINPTLNYLTLDCKPAAVQSQHLAFTYILNP
jgi:hypothetical protein